MTDNLAIFKEEFLGAKTWTERKDGVPLYLLDELSPDELKLAERELMNRLSLYDDWPVIGLGHIGSKQALPVLYDLLEKSRKGMKITIAHSIFQIAGDERMKEIVLKTMPKIKDTFELINVLYYLPDFKDERITAMLHTYRHHKKYLVACNATHYLGLPTDEVIKRFHEKRQKSFWTRLFGK